MPLPKDVREDMARRYRAAAEEADRDRMWDLVRTALACFGWAALGIFLILWATHTTDATNGRIAFYAGIAIGNGGIVFTLVAAYRRGEERGDW